MSDEQRVRTMCGWVGVEISRSRVRTPGKAGFGLYRVRGSMGRPWRGARELEQAGVPRSAVTEDLHGERGLWTEYLFELEAIEAAVQVAIAGGKPAKPLDLVMYHPAPKQARGDRPAMLVPTRWTSAYRGRRDLGVPEVVVPVTLRPEAAHRVAALAALVDEGLVQMWHVPDGCVCEGTSALTMACVDGTMRNPYFRGKIRERQAEQMRWGSQESPRQKAERLAGLVSEFTGKPVGMAECGCPNNVWGAAPALHVCRRCGFEGGFGVHADCPGCERLAERDAEARANGAMRERLAGAGECSHPAMGECPYGLSLGEHPHPGTGCDRGGEPHLGPCMTARQRQREANNEFQREHLERRAHGLRARYAAKELRNGPQQSRE